MNNSQIDQLLEKYWNVETTLQEEKLLKEYFSSGNIDASHQQHAHLFQYLKNESEIVSERKLELTEELVQEGEPKIIAFNFKKLMSMAAAFIFLIAAYFGLTQMMTTTVTETSYTGKFTSLDEEREAQEAYEITMEALAFMSSKIKTTETEIQKNLIPVQKAIEVIY